VADNVRAVQAGPAAPRARIPAPRTDTAARQPPAGRRDTAAPPARRR